MKMAFDKAKGVVCDDTRTLKSQTEWNEMKWNDDDERRSVGMIRMVGWTERERESEFGGSEVEALSLGQAAIYVYMYMISSIAAHWFEMHLLPRVRRPMNMCHVAVVMIYTPSPSLAVSYDR